MDDGGRAAADDLEAVTPGLEAIVTVLEVAEVVFVEWPDSFIDRALDVGAREDDSFDLRVGVEWLMSLSPAPTCCPQKVSIGMYVPACWSIPSGRLSRAPTIPTSGARRQWPEGATTTRAG
jgi:hypothetical protein